MRQMRRTDITAYEGKHVGANILEHTFTSTEENSHEGEHIYESTEEMTQKTAKL